MNSEDWKAKLGAAFNVPVPETEAPAAEPEQEPKGDALSQQGGERLHIVLEKKGRKGKQATIITGFKASDDAVAQVAQQLKRYCGVGGSSRGGEILLQGDWREKAQALLRDMGFKV